MESAGVGLPEFAGVTFGAADALSFAGLRNGVSFNSLPLLVEGEGCGFAASVPGTLEVEAVVVAGALGRADDGWFKYHQPPPAASNAPAAMAPHRSPFPELFEEA